MSLLDTASLIVTPNGYKEGTLYSVIPSDGSGDMSVVRATTATRVNSAGLVELVPYNLLSYSEQFDNGYWSQGNSSITTNAITAPNGTLTADKLVENSANSNHIVETLLSTSVGQPYTTSIYFKKAERNFALVGVYTNELKQVFVNLTTGAVTNTVGTILSSNVETLDNGWFRVSLTFTATASVYAFYAISDNGTNFTYQGDGTSGAYIWGAQLVEGTLPKDYQKTETRLNIPRLDYSNGTCPSLLVEPQRTNVLRYSEDFTNGVWGLYSSGTGVNPIVTANTTISPSGILNADTIVLNAGAGTTAGDQSQIYQTFPITNGNVYTFSFYAKGSVGGEQLLIRQAAGGSYTKITLTNQWARYQVTETATYSGTGFLELLIRRGLIEPINASATFYAWGSQIEQATYPTSYIPTTSASVTRNADVVSKTGISSLIGQTEGTVFVDFNYDNSTAQGNPLLFSFKNTAFTNEVYAQILAGGGIQVQTFLGGVQQSYLYYGGVTNGHHKIAYAYKQNDFILYVDGVQVATDTSGNVPTTDDFCLGYFNTAFTPTANYNASALWKTRLTNTQLAQLTTI